MLLKVRKKWEFYDPWYTALFVLSWLLILFGTLFPLLLRFYDYLLLISLFFILGPAPESVTNEIFRHTKEISSYMLCKELDSVDFSKSGYQKFTMQEKSFHVEVVNPVKEYVILMKSIFDFPLLKEFVSNDQFKIIANGMNGGKRLIWWIFFLDFEENMWENNCSLAENKWIMTIHNSQILPVSLLIWQHWCIGLLVFVSWINNYDQ